MKDTLMERSLRLSEMLNNNRSRIRGGYAVDFSNPELIETFAREIRNEALEEAAKQAQGPDEGYLHGCPCRGRIRGLVTSSEKKL